MDEEKGLSGPSQQKWMNQGSMVTGALFLPITRVGIPGDLFMDKLLGLAGKAGGLVENFF
ncbi:MAG: hypothetical protein RIG62_08595 [Cyclobacteriaceae bacterium]